MGTIDRKKTDTSQMSLPRRIWEGWKKIARKIGDFNARVILTIFYLVLLMPFAILVKLFTDPLEIKKNAKTGWLQREEKPGVSPMERAVRQF
ncbi:MAG: hypothetical protein AB1598_03110 [Thermodesulfobacteriota bacterium]